MAKFQVFMVMLVVTLTLVKVDGQYYGRYLPCPKSYMDPDGDCLAGIGGKDYPMLSSIPKTSFKCSQHPVKYVGYFADVDTQCQVFHVCTSDGRTDTFLCPNGTLFNQQFLVCDWWFNVKCQEAYKLYSINDYLEPPTNFRPGKPLSPKEAPIPYVGPPTVSATDSPQDRGPSLWSTLLSAASSSLLSSALSSGSQSSKGSVYSVPLSASGSDKPSSVAENTNADSWSVPVTASMSYPGSTADRKDRSPPVATQLLNSIFSLMKAPKKQNTASSNGTPQIPITTDPLSVPILPRTKSEPQHDGAEQMYTSNNTNGQQTDLQSSESSDTVGKPRQI